MTHATGYTTLPNSSVVAWLHKMWFDYCYCNNFDTHFNNIILILDPVEFSRLWNISEVSDIIDAGCDRASFSLHIVS